jgi:hypothetical protein
MDILKRQFPIKSLIFLKSNCHAKMAPDIDRAEAHDQYGREEIFKKHRAAIEAAASDKFDRRGEDEMYEGMPVVRVFSDDCQARSGSRGAHGWSARSRSAPSRHARQFGACARP